jgi:hypothetical protein
MTAMAVDYVVNASSDENGHISGGSPGDQTGREVRVQSWYNRPWNLMLRYEPDPTAAAYAAECAAKLANSNLVGYNQNRRMTLYNKLRAVNFDVDAYIATGELTEVDCSSFVYTVYACALPFMRYNGDAPSTGEMYDAYTDWGFTPYRSSIYLDGPSNLIDGDVLVYEGHHTVIAYDPGDTPPGPGPTPDPSGELVLKKKEVCATFGADFFDRSIAGKYTVDTDLYLRNGPGVLHSVLTTLPEGATVYNYGYYDKILGKTWLYVEYHTKDTIYTGFASAKYLTFKSKLS